MTYAQRQQRLVQRLARRHRHAQMVYEAWIEGLEARPRDEELDVELEVDGNT